jgi:hypothetical protein
MDATRIDGRYRSGGLRRRERSAVLARLHRSLEGWAPRMRMRFWRRPPLPAEKRHALELWIRRRFLVLEHDPMVAIIGAVARLTDEGMDQAAAIQLVVEILGEGTPAAP